MAINRELLGPRHEGENVLGTKERMRSLPLKHSFFRSNCSAKSHAKAWGDE